MQAMVTARMHNSEILVLSLRLMLTALSVDQMVPPAPTAAVSELVEAMVIAPPVDLMVLAAATARVAPAKVTARVPAVLVRPSRRVPCVTSSAVRSSLMLSAEVVEVIPMDPPVTVLPIVPPLSVVHYHNHSVVTVE